MEQRNFGKMPRRKPFFLLIPLLVLGLGWVVMALWNAILTEVAALKPLSYWQAVGLLLLCRILFGGFGPRGGGRPGGGPFRGNREWRQRWMNMSDEERAALKDEWRKRCGR